jgi:asparagine synthase (glutamine-hydrolysing)
MVNFAIVVDHDPARRLLFLKTALPDMPPVEGLITSQCSCEDFLAVWAGGQWAPISHAVNEDGAAVIWGEAIRIDGSTRVNAKQLQHLWNKPEANQSPAFDGFHAAAVYSPEKGLVVGADLLGIFPIYYYTTENTVLVASSPELFRHHPDFRTELDPTGLVGILLTNGLFDGHTLLHSVKRLAPGHLLKWQPEKPAKEVPQYTIPLSSRYFDLSFHEHVEILDQAIDKAIDRHVPPNNHYSLLLSGGLDSRTLAGYLKRKQRNVTALTIGLSTDIDMQCATKVTAELGFKHHKENIDFSEYLANAELAIKWEHLANGFHGIGRWGFRRHLRKLAPRVIASYLGDAIIGGLYISWARTHSGLSSRPSSTLSFEAFFEQINKWGIHPKTLKKLLQHEIFDDLVEETVTRIRKVYESYSQLEFQRAWSFDLHHQQRFHAGSVAWALSFGAWPVLPIVDHEILEVAGGMPITTLENRRMQKELLRTKFPHLARLPLDHSSYDTTPITPTTRQRIKQYLYGDGWIWKSSRHARRLRHIAIHSCSKGNDPRYYYRIWDINNQGWRKIRRRAEPNRRLVYSILNEDEFGKLLPTPDATIKSDDGVIGTSGMNCLLGLLLWAENHLQQPPATSA